MNRITALAGLITFLAFVFPLLASTGSLSPSKAKLKVAIVKNDSDGPKYMVEGGLLPLLESLECEVKRIDTVALTPEEEKEYGEWNRDALESRHIGRLAGDNRVGDGLIVGLLTNCTDLLGMLAGLQHLKPSAKLAEADERSLQREGLTGLKPLRVGLVYFDAHAGGADEPGTGEMHPEDVHLAQGCGYRNRFHPLWRAG